jgi:hypothetical protein
MTNIQVGHMLTSNYQKKFVRSLEVAYPLIQPDPFGYNFFNSNSLSIQED